MCTVTWHYLTSTAVVKATFAVETTRSAMRKRYTPHQIISVYPLCLQLSCNVVQTADIKKGVSNKCTIWTHYIRNGTFGTCVPYVIAATMLKLV